MIKGGRMSKQERLLISNTFTLTYNVPNDSLDELFSAILPQVVPPKAFPNPELVKYFYCDKCYATLNFDQNSTDTCKNCDTPFRKKVAIKKGNYFIYIPLKKQLEELVNSSLYKHFRKECDENDIINGDTYKLGRKSNKIAANDITIQWNVGTVNLSKSSKLSMWPILVMVNELPYKLRKNNVMLCGLWHGNTRPPMNIYLEPFIEELEELHENGLTCTTFMDKKLIAIKVHNLVCSVNSIVRPLILNMNDCNGCYGCLFCLHKGEQISLENAQRVYPWNNTAQGDSRTSEDHLKFAKIATVFEKIVKGAKGPSITFLAPHVDDLLDSYPPDYVDSCLLGVGQLLVTEWFDPRNREKEFYLGSKSKQFDGKLLSIKPPREVTKILDSNRDTYTPNDWKNFILFYSMPCLEGLMEEKYLKHWHCFVTGLNVFLKMKITDEAESAFQKFVQGMEELYGIDYMSHSVHVLIHMPKFVKKYGALWA